MPLEIFLRLLEILGSKGIVQIHHWEKRWQGQELLVDKLRQTDRGKRGEGNEHWLSVDLGW